MGILKLRYREKFRISGEKFRYEMFVICSLSYRSLFIESTSVKSETSSIKEKLLLQPSTMKISYATNSQGHRSKRLSSQGEKKKRTKLQEIQYLCSYEVKEELLFKKTHRSDILKRQYNNALKILRTTDHRNKSPRTELCNGTIGAMFPFCRLSYERRSSSPFEAIGSEYQRACRLSARLTLHRLHLQHRRRRRRCRIARVLFVGERRIIDITLLCETGQLETKQELPSADLETTVCP